LFHGKPIIGITGGIGSGKTFVADLFGKEGCMVIHSDAMVHEAYRDYSVKNTLQQWWGKMVFDPRGEIDRRAVARKIFNYPSERTRLERLIHPIVNHNREKLMNAAAHDASIKAYVWDTPLLFETELNKHCDAVVFVDAPLETRATRVQARGWGPDELADRENTQMPLEKKQQLADESISNATSDGDSQSARDQIRSQVKQILSRILERTAVASKG
jgi:dephospho-CoA kinase